MNTTIDAPLFHLFWENSSLNSSRSLVLRERIAVDAAQTYHVYRPSHRNAVTPLPGSSSLLENVWSQRRSQRMFANHALSLLQLSNLFRPFAVTDNGGHALPSGGGKYPMQLYAALLNVQANNTLAGNLVYYEPEQHGLVPLRTAPNWPELAAMIGVDWQTAPAVVVFLIARSDMLTTKYGERGGRFMLLEAGAHMLALELEATSQSLAAVSVGAFYDQQVLDLLDLSAANHQAVLCVACGLPAV